MPGRHTCGMETLSCSGTVVITFHRGSTDPARSTWRYLTLLKQRVEMRVDRFCSILKCFLSGTDIAHFIAILSIQKKLNTKIRSQFCHKWAVAQQSPFTAFCVFPLISPADQRYSLVVYLLCHWQYFGFFGNLTFSVGGAETCIWSMFKTDK